VGLDCGKERIQNNVAWGIVLEGHVNEDRLVEHSHAVYLLIKTGPMRDRLPRDEKG
jgi:hypothetical protein